VAGNIYGLIEGIDLAWGEESEEGDEDFVRSVFGPVDRREDEEIGEIGDDSGEERVDCFDTWLWFIREIGL
jgi:hypothetical protein